ncbi:MAG: hypothetical protein NTU53_22045 [Planctomycetota bacterium]|nr:hypothetical protein [Planctomycetota bacterium]
MAKPFSIRNLLQGELLDFLKSSGFECTHITELVRDLTCLLASYREEDVSLFPEVFVLPSIDSVASLSPGAERVVLGNATLDHETAARVLKDCASLAVCGWAVYVAKTGANSAQYGVFRSLVHSFATSAEEAMIEISAASPVVLIRNRGRLVVELRNAKRELFTACFTSAAASDSVFAQYVSDFAGVVSSGIAPEHGKSFALYLSRLLGDILQHCHGALLAAHVPPANGTAPDKLKDGVWLAVPVGLASAHQAAVNGNDAQSLSTLQALEALLGGMIRSDGVVVFGTNGTVVGYRIFLKPTDKENKNLPDKGGGRRRTYALMKRRLGAKLKAAFFRSHDGDTECAKAAS